MSDQPESHSETLEEARARLMCTLDSIASGGVSDEPHDQEAGVLCAQANLGMTDYGRHDAPVEDKEHGGTTDSSVMELSTASATRTGLTKAAPVKEIDSVSLSKYGDFLDEADFVARATRDQRRAWVRANLALDTASRDPSHISSDRGSRDAFCWICARRGLFRTCPQMLSPEINPKITIADHVGAAVFGNDVADPGWNPENKRIVLYTDAATKNGNEDGPGIAGAAVTSRFLGQGPPSWSNASYAIIGTHHSHKAELYAIGLALDIAACEIQRMVDDSRRRGFQDGNQERPEFPSVIIMTDSQSSLYYIHDFTWQDTVPEIFSDDTFTNLMGPLKWILQLGVRVRFHWVPAHTNVDGNCRADAAAKAASVESMKFYSVLADQGSRDCHIVNIQGHPHGEPNGDDSPFSKPKPRIYAKVATQIRALEINFINKTYRDRYQSWIARLI
ncbi:uncharacterized protein JN550_011944 [Neoarthrinium moseri]|uniref:uncharacterized protein n=1 Tax=Neoarthrinium moseri TaxID=1658444 RepID=UPI001FDAEB49|nr:uncharacterized protein JN550_011944 [Neoarthrinium moseri]KAI1859636.1 hypothetical protein JN550_011944 [Neoarthrinium moseri]